MDELASRLGIDLGAYGVCTACLYEVAVEIEAGGRRNRQWVAATLWAEGLGTTVRNALDVAVLRGEEGAVDAREDFRSRGPRSAIYRDVVLHLARLIIEDMKRKEIAMRN
jgi:hypothetical protein